MNQIDISFLGIQLKARGIAGIVGAVVVLAILLASHLNGDFIWTLLRC